MEWRLASRQVPYTHLRTRTTDANREAETLCVSHFRLPFSFAQNRNLGRERHLTRLHLVGGEVCGWVVSRGLLLNTSPLRCAFHGALLHQQSEHAQLSVIKSPVQESMGGVCASVTFSREVLQMKNAICFLSSRIVLVLVVAAASTVTAAQTFSVLYNFGIDSGDPCNPDQAGIVAQGRDGDLQSTTPFCGANGYGDVFKITAGGALTVQYSFSNGADGNSPVSGLTLGTDNYFYGTTQGGGANGLGTVFKITPKSGIVSTLYDFTASDGAAPAAPPIQGRDGNLYGTTLQGGDVNCGNGNGCGTVYKLTPSGKFTVLHRFRDKYGEEPFAPLVEGNEGNFYGTAPYSSNFGGSVFKVTPRGKFTPLHVFTGPDGGLPFGPLVLGSDGNFYGTAAGGGTEGGGVVFKITPQGNFTVLHNMNGTTDGNSPFAGLVQASDGNFYGATVNGGDPNCTVFGSPGCGTLFKITPQGDYSVLYNFDGVTGAGPFVTPLQHTDGLIYGDTFEGGTGNSCSTDGLGCGVFYSLYAGLPPFVSFLPPQSSGKVGKTIEILGQGFTGTTAVSFNGTSASFKVILDTYLTAIVPQGATTGFVMVTTPNGTLKSNKKFQVIH
jgi:uncharacterized repeat protein (TIGR03803 family)